MSRTLYVLLTLSPWSSLSMVRDGRPLTLIGDGPRPIGYLPVYDTYEAAERARELGGEQVRSSEIIALYSAVEPGEAFR